MELRFTASFEKDYRKVTKGNGVIVKRIKKQLTLLQTNPAHPSLRLHKLEHSEYWSISVDKSIRIKATFDQGFMYLYHIGKHEDIY
jgi:toxin HigB-1